jgi:Flp pilus assembly protein TadD
MRFSLSFAAGMLSIVLLSTPSWGVDTATSSDAPDLSVPRTLIAAKDWPAATAALKTIADTYQHADVYSLLGFSLRNAGEIEQAKVFYAKALDFDPNHKGAHEYLGELYLKINDIPKAQEQLATLQKLCPNGCDELTDLTQDMALAIKKPLQAAVQ